MSQKGLPNIEAKKHEGFVAKVAVGLKEILKNSALPKAAGEPVKIVVGISGGPDSTALLIALDLLSARLGLSVSACHVNHQLRGEESFADQLFCEWLCRELAVNLRTFSEAPKAQERSPSESELRERRFQCLSDAARQSGANCIMLGHTLDDQIETLLFRLFRGSSAAGLIAMRPVRRLADSLVLARPMLSVLRKECRAYLKELQIEPRIDSSNLDDKFTRNFLRNAVLPLCETRFPNLRVQLERFRQQVQLEADFLDLQCEQLLSTLGGINARSWPLSPLLSSHPALCRRAIVRALEQRVIEVTYERIETIFDMVISREVTSALSLDQVWDVRVERDKLIWLDKRIKPKKVLQDGAFVLRVPGATLIPVLGKALRVEEWSATDLPSYPTGDAMEAVADLSQAQLPLLLRHRRPGDVIVPFGMSRAVSLKKYLHTHKRIDQENWLDQIETLVIADSKEVLWIPGVGISERLRVERTPSHHLYWVEIAPHVTIV